MQWTPGPRNALTDIAGIRVGHADDSRLRSGVSAILFDTPAIASVAIHGGAPGTRETALLDAENLVPAIDGIALSGGSAFGLDAPSGLQASLRARGRGYMVAGMRVPIVPGAILFDLINGGDKDWGLHSPYRDLGYSAAEAACDDARTGTVGAGFGATTASCKGGLGTASCRLPSGVTVAALVAVNAVGSPLFAGTRHFRAAPFELGAEFGGLGLPAGMPRNSSAPATKFNPTPAGNTTIGIVATDAVLDKAGAKRLAVAAHDGFAHALWPAHTDFDGDLVFGVATGSSGQAPDPMARLDLGAAAAAVMARAIARGVYAATARPGDGVPAWSTLAA